MKFVIPYREIPFACRCSIWEKNVLWKPLLDYGDKKKKKIHLPFPAGCSYDSKPVYTSGCEVYREYFKEKTVIFSERLPIGTYRFNIPLLPRYTGKYTLNPAKVELMYFPVINANNSKKEIQIIERNMKSLNLKMSR